MNDRISIGQAGLNGRPHALYRFFDRSDVLLYVGITVDPGARFKKHRGDKPWWNQVDHIGIEHFATRKEAEAAEKKAIQEEQPLHNKVHNVMVEAPEEGITNDSLACDIICGYRGIDYRGPEHLTLIGRAKSEAEDDEREFGEPDAEVASMLFGDEADRADQAEHKIWTLYSGIPNKVMERHRKAAADTIEGLGFNPDRQDLVESEVARRIGSELAWAQLSQLDLERRSYFVYLAVTRLGHPSGWPIRAMEYYQHHLDGTLQEQLDREDKAGS